MNPRPALTARSAPIASLVRERRIALAFREVRAGCSGRRVRGVIGLVARPCVTMTSPLSVLPYSQPLMAHVRGLRAVLAVPLSSITGAPPPCDAVRGSAAAAPAAGH